MTPQQLSVYWSYEVLTLVWILLSGFYAYALREHLHFFVVEVISIVFSLHSPFYLEAFSQCYSIDYPFLIVLPK